MSKLDVAAGRCSLHHIVGRFIFVRMQNNC
jgi:hypothetical protein